MAFVQRGIVSQQTELQYTRNNVKLNCVQNKFGKF